MPLMASSARRDGGAAAGAGVEVEVVDQAAGAAEAVAEPGAGAETVGHRLFDVGDAGAVVADSQPQPDPAAVVAQDADRQGAAAAVDVGVADQFAGRGDDLRLVDDREPGGDRGGPYGVAGGE